MVTRNQSLKLVSQNSYEMNFEGYDRDGAPFEIKIFSACGWHSLFNRTIGIDRTAQFVMRSTTRERLLTLIGYK